MKAIKWVIRVVTINFSRTRSFGVKTLSLIAFCKYGAKDQLKTQKHPNWSSSNLSTLASSSSMWKVVRNSTTNCWWVKTFSFRMKPRGSILTKPSLKVSKSTSPVPTSAVVSQKINFVKAISFSELLLITFQSDVIVSQEGFFRRKSC